MMLAADVVSPSLVRQRFTAWLRRLGWPPEERDDIVLAVNEAVSNAVEHAYPGEAKGEIRVAARTFVDAGGGRRVVVGVEDDGRWRPVPRDRGHRGHGLLVMNASMDSVQFDRGPRGTTVVMTSVPVPPR